MEDYNFIERFEDGLVLLNEDDEPVFLEEVISDLYGRVDDNIVHKMEEGDVAEKYGLTESQVLEAENFFRSEESGYLWDDLGSYNGNLAIGPVEEVFYSLESDHDDVRVSVSYNPDSDVNSNTEYQLEFEDNKLRAAVEGSHAFLRNNYGGESGPELRVEGDKIPEKVEEMYNSLRFAE